MEYLLTVYPYKGLFFVSFPKSEENPDLKIFYHLFLNANQLF